MPRILLFTLFFPTVLAANLSCQEHPPKHSGSTRPPISQLAGAQDAFESVCASCHGLDGKGGERGPNIASRPEVVHKSDQEFMRVLEGARAASGMPSFTGLGSQKLVALVAYIRTLQDQRARFAISGDAQRGKSLFLEELNAPRAIPSTDKAVSTEQICRSMQQRSAQERFARRS